MQRPRPLVPVSSRPGAGVVRVHGLLVLAGIVVLGLGSGAAYYRYKQPKLAAELQAKLAQAPTTAEGRLEEWHRIGAPQIHHRLTKFARFSPELPWLVTHAIAREDGDPEIWGIDCAALEVGITRLEGLTVVVELPPPVALGLAPLLGSQTNYVPVYSAGTVIPDANERLETLALHLLEGMPGALRRDIQGADLVLRVREP